MHAIAPHAVLGSYEQFHAQGVFFNFKAKNVRAAAFDMFFLNRRKHFHRRGQPIEAVHAGFKLHILERGGYFGNFFRREVINAIPAHQFSSE